MLSLGSITSRDVALKRANEAGGFYVYVLWRFDADKPEPFYVGKGSGYRLAAHESDGSCNRHKVSIMANHRRLGLRAGYSLAALGLGEREALSIEAALIEQIGRRCVGSGPLVNISPGGQAGPARAIYAGGTLYATLGEAAHALGLTPSGVLHRVKRGLPGYHYAGEDQRPLQPNRRKGKRPRDWAAKRGKWVEINGVRYDSAREAARSLDMGPGGHTVVAYRCKSDSFPEWVMSGVDKQPGGRHLQRGLR